MSGMAGTPEAIAPDTKDWTWVLDRPCGDCGFDAAARTVADLPGLLHDTAMTWSEVLARPDAAERPAPAVWSPLEYGAHVRDVHVLFAQRLRLMLEEDTPTFANWDQDATAVEDDYGSQDPTAVAVELIEAAGTVAGIYATVTDATRGRRGLRSNGDEFTVESLGHYHLHDVVHHLHDVGAQ
jgi:hypothetical protein